MYLQRVSFYPHMGNEQEMRRHLEAWVKMGQSQGRKIGLSVTVFSPEGTVFVINIRLKELAEFEQMRQRQPTDQAFQDFLAKSASLGHRPPRVELQEVIVPLPS